MPTEILLHLSILLRPQRLQPHGTSIWLFLYLPLIPRVPRIGVRRLVRALWLVRRRLDSRGWGRLLAVRVSALAPNGVHVVRLRRRLVQRLVRLALLEERHAHADAADLAGPGAPAAARAAAQEKPPEE